MSSSPPPRCGARGRRRETGDRRSSEARRAPCGRFRTATTKCDALHHISACGPPRPPGIVITRCKGNRATKTKYSPVAQLAEHSTVNRRVTGSSPVGGAKLKASELRSEAFPFSRRDSNAVTTALGAGAGAPTPNFVWSSPVEGAHKARIPKASPWGFLLYLFLWLEPVTTPPYAGAGAPAPGPRAYALGGITVFYFLARSEKPSPRCVESSATVAYGVVEIFGSSRARKIFASLVRVQSERSLQIVNQ